MYVQIYVYESRREGGVGGEAMCEWKFFSSPPNLMSRNLSNYPKPKFNISHSSSSCGYLANPRYCTLFSLLIRRCVAGSMAAVLN